MTLEEAIAHAKEISENQYICEECQKEHRQLADWLEELKTLREKSKWIPCSERLPENAMNVIAQFSSGTPTELRYAGNGIFEGIYEYSTKVIIAWMPLPEPYKEDN